METREGNLKASGWFLVVVLLGMGCGVASDKHKLSPADKAGPAGKASPAANTSAAPIATPPLLSPSPAARQILTALRERLGGAPPSAVDGFRQDAGGLRAQFASSSKPASARVLFPLRSKQAFEVQDVATGITVQVALKGARDAEAQVAEDHVVYVNAHDSGATLIHRASLSGTEDYLSFETRPQESSVAYEVTLGNGVSGLRLVSNTLEMIDAGSAPRLRVEPPYIVGADGVRTDAVLAVAGCAVDRNGAIPWGRRVTRPGAKTCTLRVSWDGDAVAYPAVLDPRWTATTGTMGSNRQEHTSTLLSSNGKVLVVGGRSGTTTTALNTAVVYDPATGTWTGTANNLTAARRLHTAVQLNTYPKRGPRSSLQRS